MSVAPLVYQQPVMCRASARSVSKRGWLALRTGQGSTEAGSPIPLTCFLCREVIGSSGEMDLLLQLWRCANMRPFDVRHFSRSASLRRLSMYIYSIRRKSV
jgi:hypothetical protein